VKVINSRKVVIAFGGILAATLATGCFGGGPGYSNGSYGYNSNYSSYASSYPHSGYNSGYSYPRNSGSSYNAGYQNGLRADENRDNNQHAVVVRDRGESRTEAQHSSVDRDKYSRNDSDKARSTEKN
jgi:hypothetical protein